MKLSFRIRLRPGPGLRRASGRSQVTTAWVNGPCHRTLYARVVGRRIEITTADRDRGERHVHRKLRFESMSEIGAGGADGNVLVLGEERPLLGGRGCGARSRPEMTATLPGCRRPAILSHSRLRRRGDVAGLAADAIRQHGGKPGDAFGAARLGMRAGLDHQECAERRERQAAGLASRCHTGANLSFKAKPPNS